MVLFDDNNLNSSEVSHDVGFVISNYETRDEGDNVDENIGFFHIASGG